VIELKVCISNGSGDGSAFACGQPPNSADIAHLRLPTGKPPLPDMAVVDFYFDFILIEELQRTLQRRVGILRLSSARSS
jgi:hypothetical protein